MLAWNETFKKVKLLLDKYKYLLIIVAAGIILMCLPVGGSEVKESPSAAQETGLPDTSLEEARIESALSGIAGVGRVKATLTLKSGRETIYAGDTRASQKSDGDPAVSQSQDNESRPAIISKQSGGQEAIVIKELYPEYKGALIVCDGADNPTVRLNVIEALSSLLGIGSDKIVVVKMRSQ